MIPATRNESAKLKEVKAAHQWIGFRLQKLDERKNIAFISIRNKYDFTSLKEFDLYAEVLKNGVKVSTKKLSLSDIAPKDSFIMAVKLNEVKLANARKQGDEILLNMIVKRRNATVWSPKNHEEAMAQFVIAERGGLKEVKALGSQLDVAEGAEEVVIKNENIKATFDARTGRMTTLLMKGKNVIADGQGFWNREKVCQAYIFALGVNDLIVRKEQTGELSDVDFLNPENNQKSFAGYFAKMIQKYRLLQPNAKFFLVTMPRSEDESENAIKKSHAELMYQFAEKFPHTYVIDLYQYAPVYDEAFRKAYYLYGHMSPCGYLLTAKMIASYIDYIVRSDMDAFKQVAFIGTPQYQEKIS